MVEGGGRRRSGRGEEEEEETETKTKTEPESEEHKHEENHQNVTDIWNLEEQTACANLWPVTYHLSRVTDDRGGGRVKTTT